MTFLDRILRDVADELSASKSRRTAGELRSMAADAPPVRSMAGALAVDFGLIAEIKERSPSVGPMREANVKNALSVYIDSPIVRGISVLTNTLHFGMDVTRLSAARAVSPKPLLRKDFFVDEYQVREARAFGADAILLMANVLDAPRLSGFYDLARELGMDALFEVHTEEEIHMLPQDAKIVGINSRKFKSDSGFVGSTGSSKDDFSLDFSAFELAEKLPASALKIAESGLSAKNIASVPGPFDAALVGTSLLRDERGIEASLNEFQEALNQG